MSFASNVDFKYYSDKGNILLEMI